MKLSLFQQNKDENVHRYEEREGKYRERKIKR